MFKNKSKILIFIIAVTSVFVDTKAQEDSTILGLDGGQIESRVGIVNNLFYGIGGKTANLGSISSWTSSSDMAFWNPARLAKLNRNALSIGIVPSLDANVGKFIDLNEEIESSTNSSIQDYKAPESEISYTQLGAVVYQSDHLSSALFAFPYKKSVFAVYYHRTFDVDLDAIFSGISTRINTKIALSDEKDDIFFNSFINGHLSVQFGLDKAGISGGHQLTPKLSVGWALLRYNSRVQSTGIMNVEGTMLFGGKENTFNDPNDNWHNDLNQAIHTEYKGTGLGGQLAIGYDIFSNFQFNLVYNWAPDINMNGFMDLVNNAVPALNLDVLGENDSADDEILDASKLKLSQLTLTKQVNNNTYPNLFLRLPKTLNMGMAFQPGWFGVHLNCRKSFSPVSFQYGEEEIGLSPDYTLRTGLDFKYVQLSGGFVSLKKIASSSNVVSDDELTLFLPLFSIGSFIKFSNRYSMNVLLVSATTPLLRTTFNVNF